MFDFLQKIVSRVAVPTLWQPSWWPPGKLRLSGSLDLGYPAKKTSTSRADNPETLGSSFLSCQTASGRQLSLTWPIRIRVFMCIMLNTCLRVSRTGTLTNKIHRQGHVFLCMCNMSCVGNNTEVRCYNTSLQISQFHFFPTIFIFTAIFCYDVAASSQSSQTSQHSFQGEQSGIGGYIYTACPACPCREAQACSAFSFLLVYSIWEKCVREAAMGMTPLAALKHAGDWGLETHHGRGEDIPGAPSTSTFPRLEHVRGLEGRERCRASLPGCAGDTRRTNP